MKHHYLSYMMTLCIATACAGGKSNKWKDIDYTPVYKAYEKRQNDSGYTQPSIIGCVDDDLYNCR